MGTWAPGVRTAPSLRNGGSCFADGPGGHDGGHEHRDRDRRRPGLRRPAAGHAGGRRPATTSSATTSTSTASRPWPAGTSFVEDISDDDVADALATGRYRAVADRSTGVDGFDVAVITVPTPLREGVPDLTFIDEAGAQLAPLLTRGATVVLESTTYPGTTEERLAPILEAGSGLAAGHRLPPRLLARSASTRATRPGPWSNTPKVVSGIDAASLAKVEALLRPHRRHARCRCRTPKEAELTKLLENTFRHVNIALVNELAMFAADLGIDVWEAIDAASTKPFGYMRFTPGPGRRRPLPAGRPELPVVAGEAHASARASASSSWPTTSTSTCPTTSCGGSCVALNDAGQGHQGQPHPAARRVVQGATSATGASHRATGSPSLLADLGADLRGRRPPRRARPLPAGHDTGGGHRRGAARRRRRRAARRPRRLRRRH